MPPGYSAAGYELTESTNLVHQYKNTSVDEIDALSRMFETRQLGKRVHGAAVKDQRSLAP